MGDHLLGQQQQTQAAAASTVTSESCSNEHAFLESLFKQLNQEGIRYAVMRNHEPLPYSAGGSDLDLIVAPECAQRTRALLFKVIKITEGVPIGIAETVGFFKVYILGRTPNCPCQWWGLRVDINVGVHYKGVRLLLDSEVVFSERRHRNIAVLSDGLAGVLGVLKEVLNNGKFPLHYASAARMAAQTDWTRISAQLAPMGPAALHQFQALLLSDTMPDDFSKRCARIRTSVLQHALLQSPFAYGLGRIRFEWSRIRRYFRPSGLVIAILGVDGAGKSTVINAILPALQAATHNAVWVQHLRPALLPPLSRLKGRKDVQTGPVLEPHGAKPSGSLGSLLRLTYLTLDYVLGHWLRVRPKIAKQPTVVLFDRYAYDMMLDPCRFRIGLPAWITGWFASLAPKPDLIFCLQGDPQVIAARKQELSEEETRRQAEALRALASNEPRALLIDTVTSIEETRDQVLLAVHDFLSRRGVNGRRND